jgi:hypothetical protein
MIAANAPIMENYGKGKMSFWDFWGTKLPDIY